MIAPMYSLGARIGRAYDRLVDLGDLAGGELARVGDDELDSVVHHDAVDDVRRGGDQGQVELALQPLAHDLEVQQAEEAAAETEAQRCRRLGLPDECGVVELQALERVAQQRVVGALDRIEAGEDHRPRFLVAVQRLARRLAVVGDRVTDLGLPHVLDAGDQIADLADAEARPRAPARAR